MNYLYIKALHIIFVVCWFAGLFYIVRLFIYTKEASEKEEPYKSILVEQLTLMQKKLWFMITWPSAIGTAFFGSWMLYENTALFYQPWMWLKFILVSFLIMYHLQCHLIFNQQKHGVFKKTSFVLRLFNELATVLLVGIVFLVVVKSTGSLVWSMLGLFVFASILMLFVFVYKKQRKAKEEINQKENSETI